METIKNQQSSLKSLKNIFTLEQDQFLWTVLENQPKDTHKDIAKTLANPGVKKSCPLLYLTDSINTPSN